MRISRWAAVIFGALTICAAAGFPQANADSTVFTRADTLRGSDTPQRSWWDVSFYDLHVKISPTDSSISGSNVISYRVLRPPPDNQMQIDLQVPLVIDSVIQDARPLAARRDGNAFFINLVSPQTVATTRSIAVYYHGKPTVAVRPPWDGGFVWAVDSVGNRWIATANEGLGASVWWPNKDLLSDEPDSQRIAITVPDSLTDVSNGRLRKTTTNADSTRTYEWFVANPINNYNVTVNAGRYEHFSDSYDGERGRLSLDFWPLAYHADTARKQFRQAKPMLQCFETWFGPFPWYEDGYKLVETPYLGMEHQSAIAYGNRYLNGYLGVDRSRTGHGMQWDYIIVHESAHEWFGNSITMKDAADMWIHESFATYAEGIYTECQQGKKAGEEYTVGQRERVRNDEPIIGVYGVNHEGSSDMYYKGANMLLTIRQLVDDDARWRGILRGLGRTFWHQTVTGKQIEDYLAHQSGLQLAKVFDQYLRTVKIPRLEYRLQRRQLTYRWANVVPGFAMPVRVTTAPGRFDWIRPTESWKTTRISIASPENFRVDENFYVFGIDLLKPATDSTSDRIDP
ncbi:MAG: M1 family metallopeptidase [Gemmatimonadaceae bacterium]